MTASHVTRFRMIGVAILCALVAACSTAPSPDVSVSIPCAPTLVNLGLKF